MAEIFALGAKVEFFNSIAPEQTLNQCLKIASSKPLTPEAVSACGFNRPSGSTNVLRRPIETAGAPRTPIIAITAHALKEDEKICLENGMDDYLSKPLSLEKLNASLEKWGILQKSAKAQDSGC